MDVGTIVDIAQIPAAYPKPFYTNRFYPGGGSLIVSNNPEEVNGQGILYQDTVQGAWRVFVHHQNKTGSESGGIPQPIKLLIMLKNLGREAASIVIERSGAASHIEPYIAGNRALVQFLQNNIPARLEIQPGSFACWGIECLGYGETFAGIYDFISEMPVETSIAAVYTTCKKADIGKLSFFKQHINNDGSFTIRGTFPYRELVGYFQHFVGGAWRGAQLGNNPYGNYLRDPWWDWIWSQVYVGEYPAGWNAVDRNPVFNWGNYGAIYKIQLYMEHHVEVPKRTDILINPRGGIYFGTIQVDEQKVEPVEPIKPLSEALLLDTVWTAIKGRHHKTICFMPAGGASLPVRLLVGTMQ